MSREFPCVYELDGKCKRYEEVGVMSWCSGDLKCGGRKPSRGDTIRAMSDLELAMHLVRMVDGCGELRYCRDLEKCGEDLNADREIPLERCAGCMLKWLQAAEEEATADG